MGCGVTEDKCQTAFWYRKATQQGHPTAQFNLGVMFEAGDGAPQNLEHAAFWYQTATENGAESERQVFVDKLKKLEMREGGESFDS